MAALLLLAAAPLPAAALRLRAGSEASYEPLIASYNGD